VDLTGFLTAFLLLHISCGSFVSKQKVSCCPLPEPLADPLFHTFVPICPNALNQFVFSVTNQNSYSYIINSYSLPSDFNFQDFQL